MRLKSKNVWWVLGGLLTALSVAAAACGESGGVAKKTEVPRASATAGGTPRATGEIITPEDVLRTDPGVTKRVELEWGSMFEESGPLAGFGIPTGDGVKLAVKEINEAGGFQVGDTIYTIKLVERDTQSSVTQTIAVATELVGDKGLKVIWGPASTGEPDTTPITQDAQVLHLCPCQNRETIYLKTVDQAKGESHWAFQTLLPYSLLIDQGARDFIKDYPDFKTFAILCVNTEVGRDVCGGAKKAYTGVGVRLTGEEYFPEQTSDYSPFLTNLRGGDPDYLFNFEDPFKQAVLLRQALELGVGRLHLTVLPADLVETLVGRPIDVPVTSGAVARQSVKPTSEEARQYFERYKAFKGGELPFASFVSLLTYDFTYMLAAAMQQAGTVDDTTAIADALETLHYDGVAENDLFFNRRHLAIMGTEPCTVFMKEITCEHVPPPPEAIEG